MRRFVKISDIDVKGSPHVRGEYRMDIVEEYAEQYRQKKHGMPDPILYKVGDKLLVADGMHRIAAMEMAQATTQTFEVVEGTWQDCVRFALRCNVANGIRRNSADKRACVMLALKEFTGVSDSQLADSCAVGDDLIAQVRKEMEDKKVIPRLATRIGKDGKVRPAKSKGSDEDTGAVEKTEIVSGYGKDSTGYPITEKSSVYWDRRSEVESLLAGLSAICRQINVARGSEESGREADLLFAECNFNALEADFDRITTNLQLALPYAVCPSCQGQTVDKCRMCSGRGIISKFKFDTQVPAELKKIRKAGAK